MAATLNQCKTTSNFSAAYARFFDFEKDIIVLYSWLSHLKLPLLPTHDVA